MIVGNKYNWKGQRERLVYLGVGMGASFCWHQFARVEYPDIVWSEVLDSELYLVEETDD